MELPRQPFQVQCLQCQEVYVFDVGPEDYELWRTGQIRYVQDAFPYLTPGEREMLISRTCEPCFDRMFPAEPDDNFTDEEWLTMATKLDQLFKGKKEGK